MSAPAAEALIWICECKFKCSLQAVQCIHCKRIRPDIDLGASKSVSANGPTPPVYVSASSISVQQATHQQQMLDGELAASLAPSSSDFPPHLCPLDWPQFQAACDVESALAEGLFSYNHTADFSTEGNEAQAQRIRSALGERQLREVPRASLERSCDSLVHAVDATFALLLSHTDLATLGDRSVQRADLRHHVVSMMSYGLDEDAAKEFRLCRLKTCVGPSVMKMAGSLSDGDYTAWIKTQADPSQWLDAAALPLLSHLFDRDLFLFSPDRVIAFHARKFATDRNSLAGALNKLREIGPAAAPKELQALAAALPGYRVSLPHDTPLYRQPLMLGFHPRVRYVATASNALTIKTLVSQMFSNARSSGPSSAPVSALTPEQPGQATDGSSSSSRSSATAPSGHVTLMDPLSASAESLYETEEGCAILQTLIQLAWWLHDLYDVGGALSRTQNPNAFTEPERQATLRRRHFGGQKMLQEKLHSKELPLNHPIHQLGLEIHLSDSSVPASVQHPFLLAISPADSRPRRVFIVFRSTVSGTCVDDVLTDLRCWTAGGSGSRPGLKHSGFSARADSLDFLRASVMQWLNDGAEVYLSGHSLGGAVAQSVASRVVHQLIEQRRSPSSVHLRCVTFGNPPIADPEYWRAYQAWHHCFESHIYRRDVVFRAPMFAPEALQSVLAKTLQGLGGALKLLSKAASSAVHPGVAIAGTVAGAASEALSDHGATVALTVVSNLVPNFAPFGRHHFLTIGDAQGKGHVSVQVRSWGTEQPHVAHLFELRSNAALTYDLSQTAWWKSMQSVASRDLPPHTSLLACRWNEET